MTRADSISENVALSSTQSEPSTRPVKIYMVLCPSYHGATLLSLVLGNHSRVFSLGDTIPPRSFLSHRCGCGETFAACTFWQRVRTVVGDADFRELVPSRPRLSSLAPLNAAMVIGLGLAATRLGVSGRRGQFVLANERFLQVCTEFSEFDIFIDGYKSLSRYMAFKTARFQIAGVIHLIRDPKSFVASAKRNRFAVERSARQWSQLHGAISSITWRTGERVYRIRYEDLCAEPDRELKKLQSWMGLREEALMRPIDKSVHWIGNSSMINFDGQIHMPKSETVLTVEERRIVHRVTSKRAREFGYI
jgi:hypothetical protein